MAQRGKDAVLTGVLPDYSAVLGVLAEMEILGLEIVEFRRHLPPPESSTTGEAGSP